MEYISLIDQLSELDKKRIYNFMSTYGSTYIDPLPPEEWLQNWSHSNQKLYRLLGNSLIKEIPYKIIKNESIIREEVSNLVEKNFSDIFNQVLDKFRSEFDLTRSVCYDLRSIFSIESLLNNKFYDNIKLTLNNGKTIQFQSGMKVAKVISKIFEATKPFFNESFIKDFNKHFENFKNKHSIILNEKFIKGTMCFSIHPLDFMTMSDNASNWSSCMSWVDEGCYHAGTIEMMNSNNIICVYLKSDKQDYDFSRYKKEGTPDFIWNNKKWRQLYCVTKEAIISGKSYPYCLDKEEIFNLLNIICDMAKENLGWNYSFGPEPYRDMIHIHSKYRFDRNRNWINNQNTKKHNILLDTKGMYNDFLNATDYDYYCVRNKVRRNKIISISGKANCICCNDDILQFTEDESFYNERFSRADQIVCEECRYQIPCCESCCGTKPSSRYITIKKNNENGEFYYCEECFKAQYRVCPFCSNIYDTDLIYEHDNDIFFSLYFPYNKMGCSNEDYQFKLTKILSLKTLKEASDQQRNLYKNDLKFNILIQSTCCCLDCFMQIIQPCNKNKLWKEVDIRECKWWYCKDEIDEALRLKNWKTIKVITDKDLIEKISKRSSEVPTIPDDLIIRVNKLSKDYINQIRGQIKEISF